jgi:hypothetical protein
VQVHNRLLEDRHLVVHVGPFGVHPRRLGLRLAKRRFQHRVLLKKSVPFSEDLLHLLLQDFVLSLSFGKLLMQII